MLRYTHTALHYMTYTSKIQYLYVKPQAQFAFQSSTKCKRIYKGKYLDITHYSIPYTNRFLKCMQNNVAFVQRIKLIILLSLSYEQ